MEEKKYLVSKIREGTVIDHIPAGKVAIVLKLLNLGQNTKLITATNVDSGKYGKKDFVKVEGKNLNIKEINLVSLIAPSSTINIIEDWEVKEKIKVKLPEVVKNILVCPNSNCIVNSERETIDTKFNVINSDILDRISFQCNYCDTIINYKELSNYLKI